MKTARGPVHVKVATRAFGLAEQLPVLASGSLPAKAGHNSPDDPGRDYRSDMSLVSPVLAALGGFAPSGCAKDQIDVGVAWQPIRPVGASGNPAFFEARLALTKLSGQSLASDQVIAAADRLGLARQIDEYLVTRTIDELNEARGATALLVAVSAESLSDSGFWDAVLDKLAFSGGVACDLTIEVRGASAGTLTGSKGAALARIKRSGCRVSLGGFGVGATSLPDLVAFDPDLVTIDRHFVSSGLLAEHGQAPLANLIALARSLGADVIAEGVDCRESARLARDAGASFQKGAWCGGARFYRSWANRSRRDEDQDCPTVREHEASI